MSPTETPSLRERKKAETWNAIHDAAAELALDDDTKHVTVEAIASEAGISQRTFFNYFPTKEDAILGIRTPRVPELPEGFLATEGLIGRTTELLITVGRSTYAEGDADRRSRLFEKFPHLLLRRREVMIEGEELVYQEIAAAMAEDPEWSEEATGHPVDQVARMLTMAAGVPLRYLLASGGMPGVRTEPAALTEALDLYQDLYRKLS